MSDDSNTRELAFDPRRLGGLMRKEALQIARDPSALLVAFVLPVVLLFLFAYAVSLDVDQVRLGVVNESGGAAARDVAAAFDATRFFDVINARDRRQVEDLLTAGDVRGFVVIPSDFDRQLAAGGGPQLQVITDGSQPNTANFVAGYAEGVFATWASGAQLGDTSAGGIGFEQRIWWNAEVESRRTLVPGALAIVMTMIGTMLTALVVAREWERGTMEALMSTPASTLEILVGKLLPYFALGLAATLGCTAIATLVMDVPLRGSIVALLTVTSAFLVPALGQGLAISALTRNQFVASQLALLSSFLPAFLLSGFLFSIESMPGWIQTITRVVPARYFVSSLQSLFLAGDVWPIFRRDCLALLTLGVVFFTVTAIASRGGLDR